MPTPGPRQVLVRIGAASLNFRDLLALRGQLGPTRDGLMPLSDGAGTVVSTGAQVSLWRVGDRVAPLFFPDWVGGPFRRAYFATALGAADIDGVLAEFIAVPEDALVRLPEHLTVEEAATWRPAAISPRSACSPASAPAPICNR